MTANLEDPVGSKTRARIRAGKPETYHRRLKYAELSEYNSDVFVTMETGGVSAKAASLYYSA